MSNSPPNEKSFNKREKPSGQLGKLLCKKCNKQLGLRDIDIKESKIKCKVCGTTVAEIKDD
jgi:ribosomal protein S27E